MVSTGGGMPHELQAQGYAFDAQRFKALQTPTLLLLDGDSPAFAKAAIEAVDTSSPNSRIAVLPGQHIAMDTAPDRFVHEVLTFLSGPS